MSMYGKVEGIIGGKGMRPTKTVQMKMRNGKMEKVPFMRFTMFCEDLTRKGELDEANGIVRRPRKQYQIILPENSRGEKLFEHLAPGRRIQVEGRMTNDPKIKDGTIYTNEKIYMNELTFLDSPREKQTERAINDMVVAGAMSDEEAAQAKDKMTRFYKSLTVGDNSPRLYFDETSSSQSGYQPANQEHSSLNPDDMPI